MDQDDDYVIISARDIAFPHDDSDTAKMLEQAEPASQPSSRLKPPMRANTEMSQPSDDNKLTMFEARKDVPRVTTDLVPPCLANISLYIDTIADSLWPVNKKIHDNPELNYKEFIAHETLTTFMRTQPGWQVTPSAYGLETAWIAGYDSGREGPVVSFNAEMG